MILTREDINCATPVSSLDFVSDFLTNFTIHLITVLPTQKATIARTTLIPNFVMSGR